MYIHVGYTIQWGHMMDTILCIYHKGSRGYIHRMHADWLACGVHSTYARRACSQVDRQIRDEIIKNHANSCCVAEQHIPRHLINIKLEHRCLDNLATE